MNPYWKDALEKIAKAKETQSKEIDVSSLSLSEVPKELFALHHLEKINLSGNYLTTLPAAFNQLSQLTSLTLDKNYLEEFPIVIFELEKLEVLHLNESGLPIPSDIHKLSKLKEISEEIGQLK